MSLVKYVMNLIQTREAERYLSDLSLREVVNWGVILRAVVSNIERSWGSEVPELTLRVSAAKPVELHGIMVSLANPTAVELSHWMGELGCGHPISVRDWRIGNISLAQTKGPASSASADEDMTFLMICATVRTGPL